MKVDICCIAKNENLTIKDWVLYNKNIGINHIWIFDNNEINDNSFNTILIDYINAGFVTILNNVKGKTLLQVSAYNFFIEQTVNKQIYNWCGFLDCDEYLTFNGYNNVNEYFQTLESKCKDISVVFFNWECYDDNDLYYYEDKPVVERFTRKVSKAFIENKNNYEHIDEHVKSFIKSGTIGKFDGNPHNIISNGKTYNTDFNEIPNSSPWNKKFTRDNAYIRHYITKSLEEFLLRKYIWKINYNNLKLYLPFYDINWYYNFNDKNEKSLDALHLLLNKYNLININDL